MVNLPLALAFLVSASPAPQVELVEKPGERHLAIDGKPTLIKGMNWGWMPIGQNYTFQFFEQPREVIIEALERDMTLLKEMGVNALRQFDGVPPEWVEYIYDRWGIMTSVNNFLGRYGMTVDGRLESPINYENPRTREVILESVERWQSATKIPVAWSSLCSAMKTITGSIGLLMRSRLFLRVSRTTLAQPTSTHSLARPPTS